MVATAMAMCPCSWPWPRPHGKGVQGRANASYSLHNKKKLFWGWRGDSHSVHLYLHPSQRVTGAIAPRKGGFQPSKPNSQKWVHFVGIGGSGLSALALFALKQGLHVSGSDIQWSEKLEELKLLGARICIGHSASNLYDSEVKGFPDAVVVSSAIPASNEEILLARKQGLQIYKRGSWIAELTQNYYVIAVSGSHGKSTTTAMLAFALQSLGNNISAIVGADVPQFPGGGNAIVGKGPQFVLEADEYDGCFLSLSPSLVLVTNVEWEHVDYFADEESVRDIFRRFVMQMKPKGTLIICGDNPGSRSLRKVFEVEGFTQDSKTGETNAGWINMNRGQTVITYGLGEGNDWRALMLAPNVQGGTDFVVVHKGRPMARVSLKLAGSHNVLNSLGVIVAVTKLASENRSAGENNIDEFRQMKDFAEAASSFLEHFVGVRRRFEFVGKARGCQIFDDYAHHPTEIRAALQAAKQRFDQQPIWVIFQPHTYSRLAKLLQDFAPAFSAADRVIVTENDKMCLYPRPPLLVPHRIYYRKHGSEMKALCQVYGAREENIWKTSGHDLAMSITGPPALYIPNMDDIQERLLWEISALTTNNINERGDIIILILGAGDITKLGRKLLHALSDNLEQGKKSQSKGKGNL